MLDFCTQLCIFSPLKVGKSSFGDLKYPNCDKDIAPRQGVNNTELFEAGGAPRMLPLGVGVTVGNLLVVSDGLPSKIGFRNIDISLSSLAKEPLMSSKSEDIDC